MPRAMLAVTRGSASWPPRTPGGQPHADTGRQSTCDQHPDTRTRRALLGLSHPAANGQPEAQHCTCHFFLHKLRTCRPTRCRMHTSKPRKPIQSRLHASQRVCDQIVFTRRLRERTTQLYGGDAAGFMGLDERDERVADARRVPPVNAKARVTRVTPWRLERRACLPSGV